MITYQLASAIDDRALPIVEVVSVVAGLVSVVLALLAIWLSFKFYSMGRDDSRTVSSETARIAAATNSLKDLADKLWADAFGLVREQSADMRGMLWKERDHEDDQRQQQLDSRLSESIGQEMASLAERFRELEGVKSAEVESLRAEVQALVAERVVRELDEARKERQREVTDAVLRVITTWMQASGPTAWDVVASLENDGIHLDEVMEAISSLSGAWIYWESDEHEAGTIPMDAVLKTVPV